LIGRQGALCGNLHRVSCKFHATEHAVVVTPSHGVDSLWLDYKLRELNLNQYATGTAQPGLSVTNIKAVTLLVPTIKKQEQIVIQIKIIEEQITLQKELLETIPQQKEDILTKYLK
jgi:restriction endonuclease S subunit